MIAALFGAALIAPAPDPAPRFAPPLGQWLSYEQIEDRDDAGARTRYRLVRRVRFSTEDAGYLAEVETLTIDGGVASGPGALFESAMSALKGSTIRLHLDAQGAITAIDDQAMLMTRLRDAIVAAASAKASPDERAALAARLAAPLTAMPEPLQRRLLGSVLSPLIADASQSGAAPPEPVKQQGASPFGGLAQLSGTRRRWIDATGRLIVETTLSGTAQSGKDGPPAEMRVTSRDTIDPATRLVIDSITTRRTTIGAAISLVENHTTLALVPR